MKSINETLKKYSLDQKQYNDLIVYTNNTNYGVIGSIDESLSKSPNECSFMFIDKFIECSLSRDCFSTNAQPYWDYIYEALIRSHDYKKFLEVLKNFIYKYTGWKENSANYIEYPYRVYQQEKTKPIKIFLTECELTEKILKYIEQKRYNNVDDSVLPQELQQILNFFNYYLSKIQVYKPGTYEILIEPKYSERVTKMVYEDYNGVLYHITEKKNIDRILKRGLQLRGNQNLYRYIEPRINFILANTKKELDERVQKIIQQKNYTPEECCILKIDLKTGSKTPTNKSSYSLDFYHDSLYKENWSVYTYGLVHPRFISVIN